MRRSLILLLLLFTVACAVEEPSSTVEVEPTLASVLVPEETTAVAQMYVEPECGGSLQAGILYVQIGGENLTARNADRNLVFDTLTYVIDAQCIPQIEATHPDLAELTIGVYAKDSDLHIVDLHYVRFSFGEPSGVPMIVWDQVGHDTADSEWATDVSSYFNQSAR